MPKRASSADTSKGERHRQTIEITREAGRHGRKSLRALEDLGADEAVLELVREGVRMLEQSLSRAHIQKQSGELKTPKQIRAEEGRRNRALAWAEELAAERNKADSDGEGQSAQSTDAKGAVGRKAAAPVDRYLDRSSSSSVRTVRGGLPGLG